jgi:hypothetical protein
MKDCVDFIVSEKEIAASTGRIHCNIPLLVTQADKKEKLSSPRKEAPRVEKPLEPIIFQGAF